MSDIADRVKNIVVEHLGVDADKVVEAQVSSMILALTALIPLNWSWHLKKSLVSDSDDAAERILTVKDGVIPRRKRWLIAATKLLLCGYSMVMHSY